MQLLIENTDGDQVVEVQIRKAAALQVVRPLMLHGIGRSSLAAALEGVLRSGVPCIVEEPSGQAAEVATDLDLALAGGAGVDGNRRFGSDADWTIAVWVGERNQHRWLRHPSGGACAGSTPVILERRSGGHKLVYFGAS